MMKYLLIKKKIGKRNKISYFKKRFFAIIPNSKIVNSNIFNLQNLKFLIIRILLLILILLNLLKDNLRIV